MLNLMRMSVVVAEAHKSGYCGLCSAGGSKSGVFGSKFLSNFLS